MSLQTLTPFAESLGASLFGDDAADPRGAPPPAERLEFDATLALRHGGAHRCTLRAELVGPADAPLVVVLGGISADRHVCASDAFRAPGWWDLQVGEGRTIDTRRLRVLSFDWLGADGTLDLPLDTADQADTLAAVLDRLGIARADALVGCSYGAMVGLQFAARHAARLGCLVALSGAHRPHPYASAWRAIQRKIVALGQLQCAEDQGLALARQLAMLSYRSPEEFAERFAAGTVLDGGAARVGAEDYLDACGARYAQKWSATAFLRLSESIDLHRVEPAAIRVPLSVLAVEGDVLAPPEDIYTLAEGCAADCRVRVLRSRYGHDAFLKEYAPVARLIGDALEHLRDEEGVPA
ncbi:homoserine O-succinyltransferase MetX [Coralloluteibacterium thermophilus]|uniref:Homoserine O-succinyltransferase n=1 Tax=Coralloluteibacterium thermophilum TaxID=2707049 RepID=A0ABV9NL15_9GAMM